MDPATSATVHMTPSVTQDIKRVNEDLKGPITTVLSDGEKDSRRTRRVLGRLGRRMGIGRFEYDGPVFECWEC